MAPSVTSKRRRKTPTLTPRQRMIMVMVAQGLSSRQIAKRLRLSVRTVTTHRYNLMRRLRVFNFAHLLRTALKHRLLTTRDLTRHISTR